MIDYRILTLGAAILTGGTLALAFLLPETSTDKIANIPILLLVCMMSYAVLIIRNNGVPPVIVALRPLRDSGYFN